MADDFISMMLLAIIVIFAEMILHEFDKVKHIIRRQLFCEYLGKKYFFLSN